MINLKQGMLQIALLVICQAFAALLVGQAHNDHIWLFGYGDDPENGFGGLMLDFNAIPSQFSEFEVSAFLGQHAVLSDAAGELLMYTDGCRLYNKQHEVMLNGDSISFGSSWVSNCGNLSYPKFQGVLLLPYPEDLESAVLIHLRKNDDLETMSLLHTLVDISGDSGLGCVTSKNQELLNVVDGDYLTAVKHGNGRDWWVITPKTGTTDYITFLLSSSGFSGPFTQSIGSTQSTQYWSGQIASSPDGQWFAFHNPVNGLDLLEFDRCAGQFTEIHELGVMADTFMVGGGVAFSAGSRFVYASNLVSLYQFDLHAPNIPGSKTLVGQYDGYQAPFPTTFFHAMLAPDHKIYLSANNGVKVLHVINRPELKGALCAFDQHGIDLPVHNGWHLPNFPHFRLGPLDQSPCDTLNLDNFPVADFRWEFDSLNENTVCFVNTSYFEPESFEWTFGDGASSIQKEPQHTYELPGTYNVCLAASNQYGEHTACKELQLTTTASHSATNAGDATSIYPNPFDNFIMIKVAADHVGAISVRLLSITGQVVFAGNFESVYDALRIDLPEMPSALYIFEVTLADNSVITGSLVKG